MGKRLLAIAAVAAVLVFAFTSANADRTLEIGFKGGANVANDYGDDPFEEPGVDKGSRTGFIGGAFFGLGISENFTTRFEVLYAQKGTEYSADDLTLTFKRDYVEIPMLAVGMFPVSQVFTFSVFAGPVFAFNSSSKAKVEIGSLGGEVDIEGIKSFDLAAAFGLGGAFAAGPVNLFFEGRATVSLTSYLDKEGLIELIEDLEGGSLSESEKALIPDASVKNIAYGIMAGIGIPLTQ